MTKRGGTHCNITFDSQKEASLLFYMRGDHVQTSSGLKNEQHELYNCGLNDHHINHEQQRGDH